jgi:glycerate 2-kinase
VASPMILICPTAFKGTLTASEATAAMADGARRALPDAELWLQPLSDGGNGLLNALESAGGGKGKGAQVAGPLGTSVTARFLVQEEQAVVETAEACGLHLVPETLRDPLRASTRGVGELLMAAAKEVVPGGRLVVGLGGSATVDAGAGMAEALGWRLLDDGGEPIPPGGAGLLHLAAIEPPADRPALPPLVVLADVTNPLVGVQGAARVFGPQKGAGPEVVSRLERGLEQLGSRGGAGPGTGCGGPARLGCRGRSGRRLRRAPRRHPAAGRRLGAGRGRVRRRAGRRGGGGDGGGLAGTPSRPWGRPRARWCGGVDGRGCRCCWWPAGHRRPRPRASRGGGRRRRAGHPGPRAASSPSRSPACCPPPVVRRFRGL